MPMHPMDRPALFVPLGLIVFGLLVWSLIWVYNDAEKRGKTPWLVCLLVLFFNWPTSLLLWYVFRPEQPSDHNRNAR